MLFAWIPFYGMIFSFIWGGVFGIGCGVTTNVLHKQVHEMTDVISGKNDTGKKLATPGIIPGAVGCGISMLVMIVLAILLGMGAVHGFRNMFP